MGQAVPRRVPRGPALTATALAARTRSLQVGTLVSGVTYRSLIGLAKLAVTLDHVSAGRAVLGIGAGWHQAEHAMFGLPFPTARARRRLLEETAVAFDLLCRQPVTTYEGEHVHLAEAVFEPKPVRPEGIPLLVGGSSADVLDIAGRRAAIYNGFAPPAMWPQIHQRLDRAAREAGRMPADVERSAFVRAELTGDPVRGRALVEEVAATRDEDPAAAAARVLTGGIGDLADGLARFAAAGVGLLVISPGPQVTVEGLARLAAARR